MRALFLTAILVALLLTAGCGDGSSGPMSAAETANQMTGVAEEGEVGNKVRKSEREWREELTAEEFRILREKGTEPAFSSALHDLKEKGTFVCAGCGQPLFSSEKKFDSGTGWPSFWAPIEEDNVGTQEDNSFLMRRTEVICSRCEGHLGHVFKDGPPPTGLRYCINGEALDFKPADESAEVK